MSGKVEIIKKLELHGTKKGIISISKIEEPYGASSESVASIAISLSGNEENIDWKVHLPLSNLDEVIETLKTIK